MPTAHAPTRRPAPTRPVAELLLEIAYHLHATRIVARRPGPTSAPKSEVLRPKAAPGSLATPCATAS